MLAFALACAGEAGEDDPLDAELIRELSQAQGSATGTTRSGLWRFEFQTEACDCPSFEVDGQALDLCALAALGTVELELVEGSGILAIPVGPEAELGVMTGAIEADGSFDVAGRHDIGTIAGPLESLRRLDGAFDETNTRAEGWAGQRLIGELAGDDIDCRATGSFVATVP
jgi:hypothetical protein